MITEDYVSFELAKLLKEKEFDEPCYQKYDDEGYLSFNHVGYINSEKPCDDFYALAPSIQITMKWLREVHHYYIQVMLDSWALGDHSGYYVVLQKTNDPWEIMLGDVCDEVFYESPEKACESAIKYCLENLI